MPPWNPDDDAAIAEALRKRTLDAMHGMHLVGSLATYLHRTYVENVERGAPPELARATIYACFAARPRTDDPRFVKLATKVLYSEADRLKDGHLTVLEPRGVDDLEEFLENPPEEDVPLKFRSASGYLALPRPVISRGRDGTMNAIKAFVWGPQETRIPTLSGGTEPASGIRVTVYHDSTTFPNSRAIEDLRRGAEYLGGDLSVPPLVLRRVDYLVESNWREVLTKRSGDAPVKQTTVPGLDPAPEGATVYDDPNGVLALRLLHEYARRSWEVDVVELNSASPSRSRSGASRGRRSKGFYVPARQLVNPQPAAETTTEPDVSADVADGEPEAAGPTGPEFTRRGDARRKITRLTAAWPVAPVVRTIRDEAGNEQEVEIRRGYVQGPDREKFTYEQLARDKEAGITHPTPEAVHATRARRRPKPGGTKQGK